MIGNLAPPAFQSLHSAYFAVLRQLRDFGNSATATCDSTSVGSRFGTQRRSTQEIVGAGFRVLDPRARIINAPQRRINLAFAIANALWVFRGSDSLSEIAFYNPHATDFSDDGLTLAGAPGSRLLRPAGGNQLATAIQRLRDDPSSRRAVVQLFRASDLLTPHRDTPCTIALQFLIRGGRLDCVTYMRSQSAAFVLPYDGFLFTMIQEAMACELRVELGSYYHLSGSLHFYADESALVNSLLASGEPDAPAPMPEMVKSPIAWKALAQAESKVRRTNNPRQRLDLRDCDLDQYWSDLMQVLVAWEERRRAPTTITSARREALPYGSSAYLQ